MKSTASPYVGQTPQSLCSTVISRTRHRRRRTHHSFRRYDKRRFSDSVDNRLVGSIWAAFLGILKLYNKIHLLFSYCEPGLVYRKGSFLQRATSVSFCYLGFLIVLVFSPSSAIKSVQIVLNSE